MAMQLNGIMYVFSLSICMILYDAYIFIMFLLCSIKVNHVKSSKILAAMLYDIKHGLCIIKLYLEINS